MPIYCFPFSFFPSPFDAVSHPSNLAHHSDLKLPCRLLLVQRPKLHLKVLRLVIVENAPLPLDPNLPLHLDANNVRRRGRLGALERTTDDALFGSARGVVEVGGDLGAEERGVERGVGEGAKESEGRGREGDNGGGPAARRSESRRRTALVSFWRGGESERRSKLTSRRR